MKHLSLLTLLPSMVFLSACSSWPQQGQGGLAEHYHHTHLPIEIDAEFISAQALRLDSNHSARHLDILMLNHAKNCFPAAVLKAQVLQNRIARELEGGLYQDAANDLLIQRQHLKTLEQNINAVSMQTCQSAKSSKSVSQVQQPVSDLKAQLMFWLNVDNQFAFDSDRLNPKYAKNLTKASQLLLKQAHYSMTIIGHSDLQGNFDYNKQLSKRRAEAVKQFLVSNGLNEHKIQVLFKGNTSPAYLGRKPEIDLVNRRVTVQVNLI